MTQTVTETEETNPRWPDLSVPETLRATADEIERRGWTTGILCDWNGKVCVLGGLAATLNYPVDDAQRMEGAYDYIEQHPAVFYFANWIKKNIQEYRPFDEWSEERLHYSTIYRYNDRYVSDQDVIVGSLRRAAAAYEAQATVTA